MSIVAEFTMPPEHLPFGETLADGEGTRIEVERIVPSAQSALPFFWVWGNSPERFMEIAEEEPRVANTRLLERLDDGALFRAEWSPNAEIIQGISALDATILESEGTASRWRFEVRAQDRESFLEFQRIFREQGIPITLDRLFSLAELVEGDPGPVTPEQREVMVRAYEEGYFDSPRAITQSELGDRFDISHRAVSDRLRRGMRNLIGATLMPSADRSER